MSHSKEESPSPQKNSRRKRWEVKSKESFDNSLAFNIETPEKGSVDYEKDYELNNNKKQRPKSSHSVVSKKNKWKNNQEDACSCNDQNTDIMSAKLSALLDDAKDSPTNNTFHPPVLRESEENLIESELKNYCDAKFNNIREVNPSAPPLSPEKINKTPKKKVSVKVTPVHSETNIISSTITEKLKELGEDIVQNKQTNNESTIPGVAVSGLLLGPSSTSTFNGNVSTIYCERLNNFVISHNHVLHHQNEPVQDLNKKTRKYHAAFLQTGFRTFAVLCQGVLAGLTFAHCLMIFLLEGNIDILLRRPAMEHTFFSLIIFLSSICLVSAYDRCDLAGEGVFSEQGLRIPWTPLLYFVSVTLTFVSVRAEDFITHSQGYSEEILVQKRDLLHWWKLMCLSRTIFAVLAWGGTVSNPHTDALNSRISEFN